MKNICRKYSQHEISGIQDHIQGREEYMFLAEEKNNQLKTAGTIIRIQGH